MPSHFRPLGGRRKWRPDEANPFAADSTVPLRITLHRASLRDLDERGTQALDLLDDLAQLPEIDLMQDIPGDRSYFEIAPADSYGDDFRVVTQSGGRQTFTGFSYGRQLRKSARAMTGAASEDAPAANVAFQDLLVSRAHLALRRHLLVSQSPWIHHKWEEDLLRDANAYRLHDALQLIGLFLRTRGCYVYRPSPVHWSDLGYFNRNQFYWVLARERTPALWRYYSACVLSERVRHDDTSALGSSVLGRLKFALQARDRIGQHFHAVDGQSSRDEVSYHFDYLALLLGGALDAMARIAVRAYQLKAYERRASFRDQGFIAQLRLAGAIELAELFEAPETAALLTLIGEVRNTVHAASLGSLGYSITREDQIGTIDVAPAEFAAKLWNATEALGGPAAWGIRVTKYRTMEDETVRDRVALEPYNYAVSLVDKTLILVNAIGARTDVSRLFLNEPVPGLLEAPPNDSFFSPEIRARVALLG